MLGVSRGGNTAVDIAAARLLFAWKAEIAMAVVVVRPNGDAASPLASAVADGADGQLVVAGGPAVRRAVPDSLIVAAVLLAACRALHRFLNLQAQRVTAGGA